MQGARLTLIGSILGVAGVALLIAEASRAVAGHAILSSTAQLLMWVGLGAAAVGGFLLVCGMWWAAADSSTMEGDLVVAPPR